MIAHRESDQMEKFGRNAVPNSAQFVYIQYTLSANASCDEQERL